MQRVPLPRTAVRFTLVAALWLSGCAPAAPAQSTAAPKPAATTGGASTPAAVPTAPAAPPAAAATPPSLAPVPTTAPAAAGAFPLLTVDVGADTVQNLDPIRFRATIEKNVERLLYEALVTYDKNMQIQPALATSWSLADDKVTWTFKLRQGVKFHDGTDFNAAAAKFNLDRMIDPNSLSLNGPTYGAAIDSIAAPDDQTLQIKTKGPQSALLGMLAGWGGEMISPQAFRTLGDDYNAKGGVGTGPYQLDSFTPRDQLAVKRFPGYWGAKPNADRILVRSIPEVSARVAALASGQTQLAINVPPNQMPVIRQNASLGTSTAPTVYMEYLGLNTEKAPLDNKLVRQAIGYAVDMPAIVKTVYDGQLVVFAGPIPPPEFGYDASITGYTHDPDKAKALLQQAGVSGLKLDLWYYDRPDYVRFTQLLQEQLQAVGITANIQKMEYATYYATLGKGEQQMFLQGWGNSTGDPQPTMNSLFNSHAPPAVNLTRYKNPEVDKLLDGIKTELDPQKRKGLLSQAVKQIVEDAPMPYFFSPIRNDAFTKRLTGYDPSVIGDYDVLGRVQLAEQ